MKMVNIQYHVVYHNTMVLTSGINISLTTFLCCVCVVIILELHFIVTFKKLKCVTALEILPVSNKFPLNNCYWSGKQIVLPPSKIYTLGNFIKVLTFFFLLQFDSVKLLNHRHFRVYGVALS